MFGRACMRRAIQTIATQVITDARTMYITALLMLMSMPAMWMLTQVSSLNSFCGWNSSFLPSLPKIRKTAIRSSA